MDYYEGVEVKFGFKFSKTSRAQNMANILC